MRVTLRRVSPLLFVLCLSACGQTGALFLRIPATAVPPRLVAPPLSTATTPIAAVPDSTVTVPAAATRRSSSATLPPPLAIRHP